MTRLLAALTLLAACTTATADPDHTGTTPPPAPTPRADPAHRPGPEVAADVQTRRIYAHAVAVEAHRAEQARVEAQRRERQRREAEQRAEWARRSAAVVAPPTPRSSSGGCGGWRDLVAAAFPSEVGTACRILMCESRGNPSARSSTADHGLMQINEIWNDPGHHDPVADWIGRNWHSVYDPATNLEMARRIRAAYGWGMWACA